jgi:hypothetical protein
MTMVAADKAQSVLDEEKVSDAQTSPDSLIIEMDGVMVPVVSHEESSDRRKNKTLHWKEMRVGAVQVPGEVTAKYAVSFVSSMALGDRLGVLVRSIAAGNLPHIHGVGDGATWISEQGERVAGASYSHLIDFFHLCGYFYAAFEGDPRKEMKVKLCKKRAKSGKIKKVLARLKRRRRQLPEQEGLIACIRYIENRPGQFVYDEAIRNDLPIGSGMIESANRSLIQQRLKRPGTWWLQENADKMASLRVLRANGRWSEIWDQAA